MGPQVSILSLTLKDHLATRISWSTKVGNLTITVDEDVLRQARIRALQQGTSVNLVLGEYLRAYAGITGVCEAVDRALAVAERCSSGSGSGGRTWRRVDAHDR